MSVARLAIVVVACGCLGGTGCGGTSPQSDSPQNDAASPAQPEAAALKIVPKDSLAIGDYLPPLDGGRVEVAVPVDWQALSRHSDYVVRFRRTATNNFPRIQVTSEPDDWSGLATLTRDNIADFAKSLTGRLETESNLQIIEPVLPMMIGDIPTARYVRRTRFKSEAQTITVERQILVTLGAGRIYTIDLQTPVGRITPYRDAAYAVCASLKFAAPAEAPSALSTPEESDAGEADKPSGANETTESSN